MAQKSVINLKGDKLHSNLTNGATLKRKVLSLQWRMLCSHRRRPRNTNSNIKAEKMAPSLQHGAAAAAGLQKQISGDSRVAAKP